MFLFEYKFDNLQDFDKMLTARMSKSNNIDCFSVTKTENKSFAQQFLKTVTAMANSSKSILFLGIKCKQGKISNLENLPGNLSKEYIHSIINANISPLPDYEIIEFSNEDIRIIALRIKDTHSPHQFSDGRFYIRKNSKNQIMTEAELRYLFFQKSKPQVEFVGITNTSGIPSYKNGKIEQVVFFPKFIIRNAGNAVENIYKVNISIPTSIIDTGFLALQNYFSHFDENNTIFSIPAKSPLFQNELSIIAEAKLIVTNNNFQDFFNGQIKITIYYSQSANENIIKTFHTFTYNKKTLNINDFLQAIK
jgi:hypothetical protein